MIRIKHKYAKIMFKFLKLYAICEVNNWPKINYLKIEYLRHDEGLLPKIFIHLLLKRLNYADSSLSRV